MYMVDGKAPLTTTTVIAHPPAHDGCDCMVVQQYMDDVMSGTQVACKWVRLAVERQMRDLETGSERGLHFDEAAGQHAIEFFGFLKHSKGEWAGNPVHLEPWQQFILWVIFGWKREDGTRRFRTTYEEVARKNGKSTIGAGIGLYLMVADGEPGAEVYSAATKKDQAKITHSEATRMVKASPFLRKRITVFPRQPAYRGHRLEIRAAGLGRRHDGRTQHPRRGRRRGTCP